MVIFVRGTTDTEFSSDHITKQWSKEFHGNKVTCTGIMFICTDLFTGKNNIIVVTLEDVQ